MKIVVSIPVHEKPDVINDMIFNINKYIENPIIVLHISEGFYRDYNEKDIELKDNVFINPKHLTTQWGGIYKTHICNFNFIKNILDFDYILLQASNDLFVKKGIEKYISRFDAGFNRRKLWQHDSMWWPCSCANDDLFLKKIMVDLGITQIYGSQVEGSFYKKEIFKNIADAIDINIGEEEDTSLKYPREEIYYSTIASKFVDFGKCGYPTTFSEVHRFDRMIWKIRTLIDRGYYLVFKNFLDRRLIDKIEGKINDVLFKSRCYRITKDDIEAIRNQDDKKLVRNEFLCDYPGYWQISDGHYFSIKRVARNIADPIRIYIRNL